MKIIPYDGYKHLNYVRSLLEKHEMAKDLINELPKSGLIAFDGEVVVALGFIREVEGNYAILDSYITNPLVESQLRDEALDLITEGLIQSALLDNKKMLLAISSEVNIIARSIRHGFKMTDYKVTRFNYNK